MSVSLRGKSDSSIEQVLHALKKYDAEHAGAQIVVYRQNSVSIRIRVVDPGFAGVSRAERHEAVWRFIEELPEDVQSQMSLLIPLTPEETKTSLVNLEFDQPTRSSIK